MLISRSATNPIIDHRERHVVAKMREKLIAAAERQFESISEGEGERVGHLPSPGSRVHVADPQR